MTIRFLSEQDLGTKKVGAVQSFELTRTIDNFMQVSVLFYKIGESEEERCKGVGMIGQTKGAGDKMFYIHWIREISKGGSNIMIMSLLPWQ